MTICRVNNKRTTLYCSPRCNSFDPLLLFTSQRKSGERRGRSICDFVYFIFVHLIKTPKQLQYNLRTSCLLCYVIVLITNLILVLFYNDLVGDVDDKWKL